MTSFENPLEKVRQEFLNTWPKVKDIITQTKEDFDDESVNWLLDTLEYNVNNGEMRTGFLAITAYMNFSKNTIEEEDMERAYMLGWVFEILQSACYVSDDMNDCSAMRWGKPCWYAVPNVGLLAVNDSFMLGFFGCEVLRHSFFNTEHYKALIDMFCHTCFKSTLGRHLETRTDDVRLYTMERYEKLVQYKMSHSSFVSPILAGQILAGKEAECSAKDLSLLKEVFLEIGLLVQVQADMLDVFGDPGVTGKFGTDIMNKKCNWLIVTYLETAAPADVENMITYFEDPEANYAKIIQTYNEHGLEEKFERFMEEKSALIRQLCYGLENEEMEKMILAFLPPLNPSK